MIATLSSNMDFALWTATKNHLKGEWVKVSDDNVASKAPVTDAFPPVPGQGSRLDSAAYRPLQRRPRRPVSRRQDTSCSDHLCVASNLRECTWLASS